jgi:hypothetical protein
VAGATLAAEEARLVIGERRLRRSKFVYDPLGVHLLLFGLRSEPAASHVVESRTLV